MFTRPPEPKTGIKKIAINTFYTLAAIGLLDMSIQAFTQGETRIIFDTLTFLFK